MPLHPSQTAKEWWKAAKDETLCAVVSAAALDMQQRDNRTRDLVAWRDLYIDAPREDWQNMGLFRDRRARLNAVQNIVDATHGRLAKSQTRPWIVTVDGDWPARNRAKLTSLWIDGQFEKLHVYDLGSDVLHDGLIFGTGALKFFARDGEPCCEIAWVGDLFVDRREERYRCVRTLYQVTGVDRGILAAQFPQHEAKIDESERYFDPQGNNDQDGPADLVGVIEAWRLPDDKEHPGRHVICTEKVTLLDEEWKHDTFPFEFFHWSRDPLRFWGVGMVERACGLQAELNQMSAVIEDSFRLCPPATLWVEASSQVNVKRIDNVPWPIHTYVGQQPPFVLSPPPLSKDFAEREEQILRRISEMQGLSQLSVQSQKPAGLNSGKALMVHQDIESERFYAQSKAYEQFYIGVAKQLMRLADELVEQGNPDKLTVYGGKKDLQEIAYADASMGDRPHQIRVFPTSSLATSPQGRIQQITDLVGLGVLADPNDVRELLEFPDLDRFNSVESAGRELVEKMIGEALEGKVVAAHPLIPLDYLIRRGTLEHDLAQLRGADDDALQALRDLVAHAETLLPPPEPPPIPPGAAVPNGPPMPPDAAMMPPDAAMMPPGPPMPPPDAAMMSPMGVAP